MRIGTGDYSIVLYDNKDREFTIHFSILEGYGHKYANGQIYPGDSSSYEINSVSVKLKTKKKRREIELDEEQLYKYIDEDKVSERLSNLEMEEDCSLWA